MPPDGEVELHHDRGVAKRRRNVAIGLLHDRRLGRAARLEFFRRRARVEHWWQIVDLDDDKIGGVLRHIGVAREYGGDRLADIADTLTSENRLAIGGQAFDATQTKIDRRNLGDIGERPNRGNAGQSERGASLDRDEAAMRVGRAH